MRSQMRWTWIIVALVTVTSCSGPGQTGATGAPHESPQTSTSAPPHGPASPPQTIDYSVCSEARERIGAWTRELLLVGASQKTVTDLLGPGLLDSNPTSAGAAAASDDMFDALEFFVGKLNTLDPRIREARDGAIDCLTSPAYESLPPACRQAVDATLEPERSRPGAWLDQAMRFVQAIFDALQAATLANDLVVPSPERAALRAAEREAVGPIDDMMAEAVRINRLVTECAIPGA